MTLFCHPFSRSQLVSHVVCYSHEDDRPEILALNRQETAYMATMYVYNIPTNETVNLREDPNSSAKVMIKVPYGSEVDASASGTSGWHSCSYWSNGLYTGYMMSQYLTSTNPNGSGGGGGTGVNTASWADVKAGNGVYKKESSGSAVCAGVKTLQQYLKNIGYGSNNSGNIVVDGNFGSVTETAVKYFQAECDLTVDGIVGKTTANALEAAQSNPRFTNSDYYPLNSSLFTYANFPQSETSLVARIITAEHGYEDAAGKSIHHEARHGVAKVLKNRKDRGGVTLYNSSLPRTYKNIIFAPGQYTTVSSSMAYRVRRGSKAFEQAVALAALIVAGSTPSMAPLVTTTQLYQKGAGAYNSTYDSKPGFCRYPSKAETGNSSFSFFYN